MDDNALLSEYARTGAETAFSTLVQRHIGLVYSAARRQLGASQDAEDVTQAVFIVLARKAKQVAEHPGLSGWLLQTTRYAANAHLRAAVRRTKREHEAAMQSELNDSSPVVWTRLEPHLDEAMTSLEASDRAVLAMRYFENKSAAEIAQALHLNEEAAKKRANRALEKLRKFFKKKGVTVSAGALAAAVSANAVQAAPAGLVATATSAALSGAILTSATILAATRFITMTTLQKIALTAALTVSIGGGLIAVKKTVDARAEARRLHEQNAPLAAQIEQLQAQHAKDAKVITGLKEQLARNEKRDLELAKLRGEVGIMRDQLAANGGASVRQKAPAVRHRPGDYIALNDLGYAGFATPEAAAETMFFVLFRGTYEQATNFLSPDMASGSKQAREVFEESHAKAASSIKGIQILAMKTLSEDQVELKIRADFTPEAPNHLTNPQPLALVPMVKVGNLWRNAGPDGHYTEAWETSGNVQTFAP